MLGKLLKILGTLSPLGAGIANVTEKAVGGAAVVAAVVTWMNTGEDYVQIPKESLVIFAGLLWWGLSIMRKSE